MSRSVTESVEDLISADPNVDNKNLFKDLWSITGDLRSQLDKRFDLKLDASCSDLQPYQSLDGKAKGFLSTWANSEVDWLVHSYLGTPGQSFSNMHLHTWLGPQINVPHFGMALGTIPDIFFYLDGIPRVELGQNLEYMDHYYEEANEVYLKFEEDPEFVPFVSRSLLMRQAQSAASLCYMVKPSVKNIEKIQNASQGLLTRWLGWLDAAQLLPMQEQEKLSERDLHQRKSIAVRDPANVIADKMFGKEMANRLVGTLWGENRSLPRAGVNYQ